MAMHQAKTRVVVATVIFLLIIAFVYVLGTGKLVVPRQFRMSVAPQQVRMSVAPQQVAPQQVRMSVAPQQVAPQQVRKPVLPQQVRNSSTAKPNSMVRCPRTCTVLVSEHAVQTRPVITAVTLATSCAVFHTRRVESWFFHLQLVFSTIFTGMNVIYISK